MKSFKDFNITIEQSNFTGDKIKITKILNREIVVQNYKIEKSKFNEGKCLCMQIELNGTKHVIFTGSTVLTQCIMKVSKEDFPFKTIIVAENDTYIFT